MRLEVAEQGVDLVFEVIHRRLRSEVLVDVNVPEQEDTVRAMAATVVDQQRATAELRRRDLIKVLRVAVAAVVSEEELEAGDYEPGEPGFVEPVCVDPWPSDD